MFEDDVLCIEGAHSEGEACTLRELHLHVRHSCYVQEVRSYKELWVLEERVQQYWSQGGVYPLQHIGEALLRFIIKVRGAR